MLPILLTINTHLESSPCNSARCIPNVCFLPSLSGNGARQDPSPRDKASSSSPADCDADAMDAEDVGNWLALPVPAEELPARLDACAATCDAACDTFATLLRSLRSRSPRSPRSPPCGAPCVPEWSLACKPCLRSELTIGVWWWLATGGAWCGCCATFAIAAAANCNLKSSMLCASTAETRWLLGAAAVRQAGPIAPPCHNGGPLPKPGGGEPWRSPW
mmetsp:Transcript_29049/g.82562  ORF Transcript_29049/g.82562 Transcript_29049/m.82562 type:complete len:218 (-) Transcript_29049:229-882(-)